MSIFDDSSSPDWWRWASCHTGDAELLDLFFPVDDPAAEAQAKKICGECAVQDLCLAAAIARHEQNGIWGGFNFGLKRERTKARRSVTLTVVAAA